MTTDVIFPGIQQPPDCIQIRCRHALETRVDGKDQVMCLRWRRKATGRCNEYIRRVDAPARVSA